MRKLASVVVVDKVEAIPGADLIEAATVGGWTCVIKKGEMKQGDKAVYFEIDSVLPDAPEYSFLWKEPARPANFRLTTRRFKGVVSQGLLLPFDKLHVHFFDTFEVGTDLSEALGVTKYDPPEVEEEEESTPNKNKGPRTVGGWPGLAPKTEEERVQNVHLGKFIGMPYVITRKLDGSSATYGYKKDFCKRLKKSKSRLVRMLGVALTPFESFLPKTFYSCSRNLAVGAGTVWGQMAEKYRLAEKLKKYGNGQYVLQGEIVGPKIQKNPRKLDKPDLYIFNVFDQLTQTYLPTLEAKAFAEELGCNFVPVLEVGEAMYYSQQQLLAMAEGLCPGTKNEEKGLVVTVDYPAVATTYGKNSFKVISNRYLLSKKG